MITATQCKMARAAVDWSVRDLARHANVGTTTIVRLEKGHAQTIPATLAAIQRALEGAGVEFIEGGARLQEQPRQE